jgi:(1->4)-alpha-D-glucan 1-alpha-D-glucosylmutase
VRLRAHIVPPARVHSLGQLHLKITSPGVPDFYQGSELWDERLTDPDNRRPVDFDARRALAARVEAMRAEEALAEMASGGAKLWVMKRALAVRLAHPTCFDAGAEYRALYAEGPEAERVVAFERGAERSIRVVTIVPRFLLRAGGRMPDAALELSPGRYVDAFTERALETTGGAVEVSKLLDRFPLALLVARPLHEAARGGLEGRPEREP